MDAFSKAFILTGDSMNKLTQVLTVITVASSVLTSSANADSDEDSMNKLTQVLTVITVASSVLTSSANADSDEYVYKQNFMPRETVEIDLAKTAMFVTDPQRRR
jgi:hypothetical protein